MTTEGQWAWGRAVAQAKERLAAKGIRPLPKPRHEYEDLGETIDIEELSDAGLANRQARTHAWHAYVTVEVAYAKAEFYSFDEVYDVFLGDEMYSQSRQHTGRVVKEMLKSLAILNNETLREYHRRRIELQLNMQLLDGMERGLAIQARALESESIRRASARRVELGR